MLGLLSLWSDEDGCVQSLFGHDDMASILCLQDSQRQREAVEQRYIKYKEIVWDLQHQLDESKRRIQEYRVRHTHTRRQIQICIVEK